MTELGGCEHPRCERPATRAVQVADMLRAVACCETHAADFRTCDSDGCRHLAQIVMSIGARDGPPPGRARDELWLCRECAEAARQAPTLTLRGRRFINDRAGWLIPLPSHIGRG